MKIWTVIGTIGGFLLLASGCGKVGGEGDSETHWMLQCDSDVECGEVGACLCGRCTVSCTVNSACGAAPEGSRCVSTAAAAACSAETTVSDVCLMECSANAPCPANYTCQAGACVRARGSSNVIPNPTGDCKAPDDGSRPGFHFAAGSTWLPDCENPLDREYWRVFALSASSAAIVPRLDGAPELREPCTTEHALSPLVRKYGLCSAATTEAEAELVNDILPADALAITHYLHAQLVFQRDTSTGTGIAPYPIPTDILAACALHPDMNSPELTTICQQTQSDLTTGIGIARIYTGRAAVELSGRLNQLYGIGPDCGDLLPLWGCTECGPVDQCLDQAVACLRSCATDTDCEGTQGCVGNQCVIAVCG